MKRVIAAASLVVALAAPSAQAWPRPTPPRPPLNTPSGFDQARYEACLYRLDVMDVIRPRLAEFFCRQLGK